MSSHIMLLFCFYGELRIWPSFANGIDPDQKPTNLDLYCVSFSLCNLYEQPGSSNLTGLKLELGVVF